MTKTGKIMLIGLALLLLVGLPMAWAGGKQEDKPAAATSESGVKSPIEIYNPSFVYPTEKINLALWDYYDERPDRITWLKEKAKEFQTIHPNINLTVVNIPWVGWKAKYLSAFQADTGPDICTWDPPMAVLMGKVYPAPDWAARLIDEKYTDAAKKTMIFKGQYWGWPSQIDAGQMLYYNTMYEEGGLNPDDPPETLPELLEAMKKTTKYDSQGTIIQGGWAIRYFGDVAWDISLWLNNNEHDLVLAKMQGGLPTRKSSMNSNYVQNEVPYGKTAEIQFARPAARIEVDPWGIGSEIRHQLGAAVESVIAGKGDPEPALKEAAEKARAVIAKAKATAK